MELTEEPYIPPSVGDEPTPTPAPADVYAPDPLGPEFSGMWFPLGSCYDMDMPYDTNNDVCDLVLEYNGILVPVNGGLGSGYAFDAQLDIVELNEVISQAQSDRPVAVQSNLEMCFLTMLAGMVSSWRVRSTSKTA